MGKKIILILLGMTLGFSPLFYHYFQHLKVLKLDLKKVQSKVLILAAELLQERWEEGDLENWGVRPGFSCSKYLGSMEGVDPLYLQCNPHYLQCYFSGGASKKIPFFTVALGGKKFKVKANRSYDNGRYYKLIKGRGVEVHLLLKDPVVPGHGLKVILEDSCRDTYLPQRVYPVVRKNKSGQKEIWEWDNFYQDIYVDKYKVRVRDILEWQETLPLEERAKISFPGADDPNTWPQEALGLNREQMRQFCAFKGKHLLSVPVFLAASFYVPSNTSPIQRTPPHRPYPWPKIGPRGLQRKREKSLLEGPTLSECEKVFDGECSQYYSRPRFLLGAPSWMGIFQLMGDNMEAFGSPISERENLYASSYLLPLDNPFHRLDHFLGWTGQAGGMAELKGDIPPSLLAFKGEVIPIGFRCMTLGGI